MPAELEPGVSIVIPTHNRVDQLRHTLGALERQDHPIGAMEVIVVADGCRDGTASMLGSYAGPLALRFIERGGEGPAVARNAGAATARGKLLIFLDDDCEALPRCVSSHVALHDAHPSSVVIGANPPLPHPTTDPYRAGAQRWWDELFTELADPAHRFTFRDLLTGNVSLPAEIWREFGGLDTQFSRAREDWEFGVRLMRAGVPFVYGGEAASWHHEHRTTDIATTFRRKREEGRSDVRAGRKHRYLKPELEIYFYHWRTGRWDRWIERFAFRAPRLGDLLMRALEVPLQYLRRSWRRRRYFRLENLMKRYWYLRGAAEELTSRPAWRAFVEDVPAPDAPPTVIDLADGIEAAEEQLSRLRPGEVTLRWGQAEIGTMPYHPAAERWDGRHLRRHLLIQCGPSVVRALLAQGSLPFGASGKDLEREIDWRIDHYWGATELAQAQEEAWVQWHPAKQAQ